MEENITQNPIQTNSPAQTSEPVPLQSNQNLTEVPPSFKSSKIKWINIGLVVTVIVALGGTGAYFLANNGLKPKPFTLSSTSKPTPTSPTWLIYTAQLYSFKYPSGWTISSSSGEISLISPDTKTTPEGTLEKLGSQILISETPAVDATISAQTDEPRLSNGRTNLVFTSIDGVKTLSFDQNADYYNSYSEFIKDGLEYSIQLESGSKITHERDLPIYQMLLKSFKFINSTSQTDTSSWKAFAGDGFSFKYSPEFIIRSNTPNKTVWDFQLADGGVNKDFMYLISQESAFNEPKENTNFVYPLDPSTTFNVQGVSYLEKTIDGNKLKEYLYSCGADCDWGSIYFQSKGKYYMLQTTLAGGGLQRRFDGLISTFKFDNQPFSTPTCKPRPKCLDETPRCMIPETSDMCPKITP